MPQRGENGTARLEEKGACHKKLCLRPDPLGPGPRILAGLDPDPARPGTAPAGFRAAHPVAGLWVPLRRGS